MKTEPTSRLPGVSDVASELGVPRSWLTKQIRRGRIPSLRLGSLCFLDRVAVRRAVLKMARNGWRFPRRGSADPIREEDRDE